MTRQRGPPGDYEEGISWFRGVARAGTNRRNDRHLRSLHPAPCETSPKVNTTSVSLAITLGISLESSPEAPWCANASPSHPRVGAARQVPAWWACAFCVEGPRSAEIGATAPTLPLCSFPESGAPGLDDNHPASRYPVIWLSQYTFSDRLGQARGRHIKKELHRARDLVDVLSTRTLSPNGPKLDLLHGNLNCRSDAQHSELDSQKHKQDVHAIQGKAQFPLHRATSILSP